MIAVANLTPIVTTKDVVNQRSLMYKFEKIYRKQWEHDLSALLVIFLSSMYNNIKISNRIIRNSSGHDVVTPFAFTLAPGESITITTGIRLVTDQQVWLMAIPRSGLGFKYRLQLDNTVGDIDGDYWESDNEGHILAKVTNDSNGDKTLELKAGDRFMQGVIMPYFKTDGDNVQTQRNGGHGSTGA